MFKSFDVIHLTEGTQYSLHTLAGGGATVYHNVIVKTHRKFSCYLRFWCNNKIYTTCMSASREVRCPVRFCCRLTLFLGGRKGSQSVMGGNVLCISYWLKLIVRKLPSRVTWLALNKHGREADTLWNELIFAWASDCIRATSNLERFEHF